MMCPTTLLLFFFIEKEVSIYSRNKTMKYSDFRGIRLIHILPFIEDKIQNN